MSTHESKLFLKELGGMAGLTEKQKMFVLEYLVDLNATAAARRAGYSERTADRIGPELLGKTCVQEAIHEQMEAREKRTLITADKVLAELAKIGFADIKQYLEYKTAKTVVDYDPETGEPIVDYKQIIDVIDSSQVDGAVIQEVSIGKDGTFKFKLHDKMAALDKIGKHLGMFTDKMELTGKDGGPIKIKLEDFFNENGAGDNSETP
jgi:phage terminase small subunit